MQSLGNLARRPIIKFVVFLLLFSAVPLVDEYGIVAPEPIGAYINGNLPARTPGGSGDWVLEEAYPNVGFTNILGITPAPHSPRLYVNQRDGKIYFIDTTQPNTATKTLFLDISERTWTGQDSGLLGMTFHPDFGKSGSSNRFYFYVYYVFVNSEDERYIRLSRFTVLDGDDEALVGSELVLFNQRTLPTSGGTNLHRGGGIVFDKNGYLNLSIGDLGYNSFSQEISEFVNSCVLRIDVDMDSLKSHPIRRSLQDVNADPNNFSGNYLIPNDNPFLDENGSVFEEIFALGLRNPHRMTIDSFDGEIYWGDVGSNTGDKKEEVNHLVPGGNYGWPFREGDMDRPDLGTRPDSLIGTETDPVYFYTHTNGSNCIIGGYVYRGINFLGINGSYIYGDRGSGKIWAVNPAIGESSLQELTTFAGLVTFGVDHDGEILMARLGADQKIYRLAQNNTFSPEPPLKLSQTGAFADLENLVPVDGFIPYAPTATLWSDGALKKRWIAVPNDGTYDTAGEQIIRNPEGEWEFPVGTVIMKHFELPINVNDPSEIRRLETRFMTLGEDNQWYGVTYRWNDTQDDAELLLFGLQEDIDIISSNGPEVQTWTYPSRGECKVCHTDIAKNVLGLKTYQLNEEILYPRSGVVDNQLRTLNHLGIFVDPMEEADIPSMPTTSQLTDASVPVEDRVRSYLDANCSQCHRPGSGNRANFDARYLTPTSVSGLVNGAVFEDFGINGAKVIVPGDVNASILHNRVNRLDNNAMPPLAKAKVDGTAINLIENWIQFLAAELPGNGLLGQYFAGTNFNNWQFNKIEEEVNYNWAGAGPDTLGIGVDSFSVRWTGYILPEYTETYTFYTQSDDGVRLWINDQLIIDNWTIHPSTEDQATIDLNIGEAVPIRLEYYEGGNDAEIALRWSSASLPKTLVPSQNLFQSEPPESFPVEWLSFEAEETREGIQISWVTASEFNNDHFSLERSGDGQNFQSLQVISSQGDANHAQAYRVLDSSPFTGNNYYRLIQRDKDGKGSISQIVEVFVERSFSPQIHMYPNPIDQGEILSLELQTEESFRWEIVDLQGRLLRSNALSPNKNHAYQIKVLDLPKGLYFFTIQSSLGSSVQKLWIK